MRTATIGRCETLAPAAPFHCEPRARCSVCHQNDPSPLRHGHPGGMATELINDRDGRWRHDDTRKVGEE